MHQTPTLCVYLYICVFVSMHLFVCVHACMCVLCVLCVCVCVCVCVCAHVCVRERERTFVCMYTCICVCFCMCACSYVHAYGTNQLQLHIIMVFTCVNAWLQEKGCCMSHIVWLHVPCLHPTWLCVSTCSN